MERKFSTSTKRIHSYLFRKSIIVHSHQHEHPQSTQYIISFSKSASTHIARGPQSQNFHYVVSTRCICKLNFKKLLVGYFCVMQLSTFLPVQFWLLLTISPKFLLLCSGHSVYIFFFSNLNCVSLHANSSVSNQYHFTKIISLSIYCEYLIQLKFVHAFKHFYNGYLLNISVF